MSKGFLTLEIVLAIFLFLMAISLIFSSIAFFQEKNQENNAKLQAIFLADSGMEFLANTSFSDLENGTYWLEKNDQGWSFSDEEVLIGGKSELRIDVTGDENKKQVVSSATFLNEKFELTSYFLNYDNLNFWSSVWNFDEDSGNRTYDNNETVMTLSNVKWGAGYLIFDGKKSYARVSNYLNEFYDSQAFTIEVYLYSQKQNDKMVIAKKADNLAIGSWEFGETGGNQNKLFFQFLGINGKTFYSDVNLNYEEWHHVAVTYNGSQGVFYLDGENIGSFVCSNGIQESFQPLQIGRADLGTKYFKGYIDKIAFYDRAFSEKEILKLYQGL